MNRSLNRGCELLVLELSVKFGFSAEEGMKHLGLVLGGGGVVGCERKKVGCEKKKRKKCIPVPWTGKVCKENCGALEYNNGLFTQCGSKKEMGKDYCVNCIKRQEENNGELEYGTVEDRVKKDFQGKGGKGVKGGEWKGPSISTNSRSTSPAAFACVQDEMDFKCAPSL